MIGRAQDGLMDGDMILMISWWQRNNKRPALCILWKKRYIKGGIIIIINTPFVDIHEDSNTFEIWPEMNNLTFHLFSS